MGRNIYLTEKEMAALRAASGEWCEMMMDGDEECQNAVEERLENGLGSALRKLYKGRRGHTLYADYKTPRD